MRSMINIAPTDRPLSEERGQYIVTWRIDS